MNDLDAADVRRRYLILHGLRWLPTGLLIPVIVVLMLDRGLGLGQIGVATAAQGVAILMLELPTGGLADALGRRRVLLLASAFEIASVALLIAADTLAMFAGVWALQGVYRALESGPLDAWFVDATQRLDPDADIETGLARGGVVLGIAIAVGALASSGLVALDPLTSVDPLVVPLIVSIGLRIAEVVAIRALMTEPGPVRPERFVDTARAVPSLVRDAARAVASSRILMVLVAVDALWGFGMVAFETFTPARLDVVVGTGDAAGLLGPANAVGWTMSAMGAAIAAPLARRVGAPVAAWVLLTGQALFVVGIGVAAGPAGVLIAFVLTMTVHGAANPVHQGMLHRAVPNPKQRATIISVNSLFGRSGGMVGGIALGVLADATSLTTAVVAGAASISAAGLLSLVARVPKTPRRADDDADTTAVTTLDL